MRVKFSLLFFILLVSKLTAQTQTIRGVITDKETGQPLPGASVLLLNSDPIHGTASDIEGKFKLSGVIIGRHDLKFSFVGYKEIIISNLIVDAGRESVLNIQMEEKVMEVSEAVVTASKQKDKALNEMATVSGRQFSVEDTRRYPGTLSDPARMAQNFAGVTNSNDQRNDIIIRGNSPSGLLWRLEGIDIPSPNHFSAQGTTGGPISILNNNLLKNSDFFTGAFPAEYGNATAGVFDLKMRTGNNESHEYLGQVGLNGVELNAEGPFNKNHKSSYLASYRYSTLDLFTALGINLGTSGIPKYQDAALKLVFPTEKGTYEVFGVGGTSTIAILDSKRKAQDWSFGQNHTDLYYGTDMGFIGTSFTKIVGTKGWWKTTVAVTGDDHNTHIDSISKDSPAHFLYGDRGSYTKNIFSSTFNYKFNAKNIVKIGLTFNRLWYFTLSQYYSSWEKKIHTNMDSKGSTFSGQVFGQWKHNFNDNLSLITGLHYEHFFYNNKYSIEPRGGLKWSLNNRKSISFGYGIHGQLAALDEYLYKAVVDTNQTRKQTNHTLGYYKSQHFIFGFDQNISTDTRLKIELYYQSLFDVPVESYPSSFSMLNTGSDFGYPLVPFLKNNGTGRNYGIDLTFEKFFSKGYYYLTTLSIFDSKYKGSDGVLRNTYTNGKYATNAVAGKEFKLGANKILALDLRATAAGGRWHTPIDTTRSRIYHNVYYDYTKAFSQQYPDYIRADFKISFKKNGKKVTQVWLIDIQNITNRKNVLTESYNPSENRLITEYQLGIFPVGSYRIEF